MAVGSLKGSATCVACNSVPLHTPSDVDTGFTLIFLQNLYELPVRGKWQRQKQDRLSLINLECERELRSDRDLLLQQTCIW